MRAAATADALKEEQSRQAWPGPARARAVCQRTTAGDLSQQCRANARVYMRRHDGSRFGNVRGAAAQCSQGKGSNQDDQCSGPCMACSHKCSSGDTASLAVLIGGQQRQQRC